MSNGAAKVLWVCVLQFYSFIENLSIDVMSDTKNFFEDSDRERGVRIGEVARVPNSRF